MTLLYGEEIEDGLAESVREAVADKLPTTSRSRSSRAGSRSTTSSSRSNDPGAFVMRHQKVTRMVLAAMFAAITTVASQIIFPFASRRCHSPAR